MGRTLPTKDAEFIAWTKNLAAQCTEHQSEWGLNPSSVQKLNELTRKADESYWNNLRPDTRNRASRVLKTSDIKALRSFLSMFILALRANEAIGESDLGVLGLPSRKRQARQPLPAPGEAPKMSVVTRTGHEVRVYVSVEHHEHPVKSLTRKAYHGFVVRYRIEGSAEWHDVHSTRLHTDLSFGDEDNGKHLTLMAAWINPRLQHGPWSRETTVLIN